MKNPGFQFTGARGLRLELKKYAIKTYLAVKPIGKLTIDDLKALAANIDVHSYIAGSQDSLDDIAADTLQELQESGNWGQATQDMIDEKQSATADIRLNIALKEGLIRKFLGDKSVKRLTSQDVSDVSASINTAAFLADTDFALADIERKVLADVQADGNWKQVTASLIAYKQMAKVID